MLLKLHGMKYFGVYQRHLHKCMGACSFDLLALNGSNMFAHC
jgi:hypothetical protein